MTVVVSKRAGEREPGLAAKARARLPGDDWRGYVSVDARRAYDGPLEGREGTRPKRRYKIRRRGYDRKYGEYGLGEKVDKAMRKMPLALTRTNRRYKAGPFGYTDRSFRLGRKSGREALVNGLGGVLPKYAILGLGGALLAQNLSDGDKPVSASEQVKHRVKAATQAMTGIPIDQEKQVSKSLVEIRKSYDPDLVEKGFMDDAAKRFLNTDFGGMKVGERAANHGFAGQYVKQGKSGNYKLNKKGRKLAGNLAGAAGAAGGAAGAYGGYRMARNYVGRKAKKAALYGALGLGGTVAAGTMAGNAING